MLQQHFVLPIWIPQFIKTHGTSLFCHCVFQNHRNAILPKGFEKVVDHRHSTLEDTQNQQKKATRRFYCVKNQDAICEYNITYQKAYYAKNQDAYHREYQKAYNVMNQEICKTWIQQSFYNAKNLEKIFLNKTTESREKQLQLVGESNHVNFSGVKKGSDQIRGAMNII